jgi:hypothetical protein
MNFFEAMEELKSGNRVRVKGWEKESYIGLKEEEAKVFGKKRVKYSIVTESELPLSPNISFTAFVSAQWELYED